MYNKNDVSFEFIRKKCKECHLYHEYVNPASNISVFLCLKYHNSIFENIDICPKLLSLKSIRNNTFES